MAYNWDIPERFRGDLRLLIPLEETPCQSRTYTQLEHENIYFIGQAIGLSLRFIDSSVNFNEVWVRNFGKKSAEDLERVLKDIGLRLGMYSLPVAWMRIITPPREDYTFDRWKERWNQNIRDGLCTSIFVSKNAVSPSYEAVMAQENIRKSRQAVASEITIGPQFTRAIVAKLDLKTRSRKDIRPSAENLEHHLTQ